MAKSKIRDFFSWSDDEVELLLKVTQEYKAAMAAQSTDWESSQSKYGDILERYREYYPSSQEAMATGKEFPHKKEELTKGQLTTKLKAIRFKYRQAVDSGRKRGHGRVILLYFELCDSIWGEAPVTQVLSEGIKTEDVQEALDTTSSAYGGSSSLPSEDGVAEDAGSAETAGSPCQRLSASLCGYRRNRLKRKLVMDSVTQEDLDIKRRLLQRLEATDDYFVQTMGHWSSTMDRLSDNIERLVQHIVCSGNNLPTHHTHPTTAPIPMDTQAQEGHS